MVVIGTAGPKASMIGFPRWSQIVLGRQVAVVFAAARPPRLRSKAATATSDRLHHRGGPGEAQAP